MMKNRCLNPNAEDFLYYGGRGIGVAPEWMTYEGFIADMGLRPEGTTLERKDGASGYSKDNCCWATRLDQSRNRAYTRDLTFNGRTQKVWEWAYELRLRPQGIHFRLWRHKKKEISWADVFKPNPRTT